MEYFTRTARRCQDSPLALEPNTREKFLQQIIGRHTFLPKGRHTQRLGEGYLPGKRLQQIAQSSAGEPGRVGGEGWISGRPMTFHNDDYISFFIACFDIAVRLGGLLQKIAPIYDRFNFSRLNQRFEVKQIID